MFEAVAFYLFAFLTISMFFITVTTSQALYALTALAAGMIFISAFFFILGAEFLGAVQIVVNSGAVMALYAFGMMFFDTTRDVKEKQGNKFIIVGLAFKVSAVPFHMWTPDVYEGSPTSVTSFFALVPKIAAISVFIRFMYVPFVNVINQWQTIIIFLSIASMILGAVAAIGQFNIKRLMAYSSIGHMGYALVGIAAGTNAGIQSTIIYLTIYLVMNLGAFGCIFMMKRKDEFFDNLEDLSGLSKNHPIVSLSMLILLFSLAGIPPMAGFFGLYDIFLSYRDSIWWIRCALHSRSAKLGVFP